MAYFITNKSGYRSAVSEKIYNELVDKQGYKGEITDEKNSTDYTISELREIKSEMSVKEWEEFTKSDTRKSIDSI